jgi:hypothetical protein
LEWFLTTRLQWRVARGGEFWISNVQSQNNSFSLPIKLTSPCETDTSIKPNAANLVHWKQLWAASLQLRVDEGVVMLEQHLTQKIDQDGHLLNTNLPPPAAHTSNESNTTN